MLGWSSPALYIHGEIVGNVLRGTVAATLDTYGGRGDGESSLAVTKTRSEDRRAGEGSFRGKGRAVRGGPSRVEIADHLGEAVQDGLRIGRVHRARRGSRLVAGRAPVCRPAKKQAAGPPPKLPFDAIVM